MNIDLRQAIIKRLQGKSEDELREVIEDSIGGDEKVLPGLGVLFEKIWQNCEPGVQEQLVHSLESGMPR